jgi:hypothetical protein
LEDAVGHHGTLLMILGCECDWDWLNRRPESKRVVDCLDDEHGIVDWPGEDYFATILRDYLATSRAKQGGSDKRHEGKVPGLPPTQCAVSMEIESGLWFRLWADAYSFPTGPGR